VSTINTKTLITLGVVLVVSLAGSVIPLAVGRSLPMALVVLLSAACFSLGTVTLASIRRETSISQALPMARSLIRPGHILVGLAVYYIVIIALGRFLGQTGGMLGALITLVLGLLLLLLLRCEQFFAVYIAFLLTYRTPAVLANMPGFLELGVVVVSFASVLFLLRVTKWSPLGNNGSIVLVLVGLFGLVWTISALINPVLLPQVLISGLWRFYGFFVFVTIYFSQRFSLETLKAYGNLILGIVLLQIPIQIAQTMSSPQQMVLWGTEFYGIHQDYIYGTFGPFGTRVLAVFLLFVCYGAILYGLFNRLSWKLIAIIGASFVSSILGDAAFFRFGMFVSPLVIVALLMASGSIRLRSSLRYALLLFFLLPIAFIGSQIMGENITAGGSEIPFTLGRMFSADYISWYASFTYYDPSTGYYMVGRLPGLYLAIQILGQETPVRVLVGLGPDSTRVLPSSIFSFENPQAGKFWYANQFGLDKLILEMGLLGTMIYLVLLAYLFARILRFIRYTKLRDLKLWGLIYLSGLVIFVATGQYDGGWFEVYQKVIVFWVYTAIMLRIADANVPPKKIIYRRNRRSVVVPCFG